MPGEGLIVLDDGDLEKRVRSELEASLGAERQRRYRRFCLPLWAAFRGSVASSLLLLRSMPSTSNRRSTICIKNGSMSTGTSWQI